MTTYQNTTPSASIYTSIGEPTLSNGDVVDLVEGASDYTQGLANLSGVELASFTAHPGFTGTIGGDGASLMLDAVDVRLLWGGRRAYLEGVAGKTIASLLSMPATGNAATHLAAMSVTSLNLVRGEATVADTVTATTVRVLGGSTRIRKGAAIATLEAAAAVGAPGSGGTTTVDLYADVGTVRAQAGSVVRALDLGISPATLAIDGGRVEWRGGDIGTLSVGPGGGILDLSALSQSIAIADFVLSGPLRIVPPMSGAVTGWEFGQATGSNVDNAKVGVRYGQA
ncbi:MAG: hypothetical protein AAGI53_09440 [Planctomycetota bacterium]